MEAHLRVEVSSHQRRSHNSTIGFELGGRLRAVSKSAEGRVARFSK